MFTRLVTSIGIVLALTCSAASLAPAGGWAPNSARNFDGRSPDTKDAAIASHSAATSGGAFATVVDGRSPDTRDAATATPGLPSPVLVVGATGFDWTDAGIGAAAGFGLAIMLAAGVSLTRSRTGVVSPS